MSLTVQQLLADAKRLSNRLRDHDQTADQLISRTQEVLKEVEAMRQYEEDVENLNEIAHNRPRAHLVLGIQQENRHIRTLQQENKELRSALEEHQSALELIMSKYREHITRLVSGPPKADFSCDSNGRLLEERTEKVCEMAAVMRRAMKLEEETEWEQRELLSRLLTENKGLRELLEISQRHASLPKNSSAIVAAMAGNNRRSVTHAEQYVQTDPAVDSFASAATGGGDSGLTVEITLPLPPVAPPRTPKANKAAKTGGSGGTAVSSATTSPVAANNINNNRIESSPESESEVRSAVSPVDMASSSSSDVSSESDETSDDDSIKFDTIKLSDRRRTVVPVPQPALAEAATTGTPDNNRLSSSPFPGLPSRRSPSPASGSGLLSRRSPSPAASSSNASSDSMLLSPLTLPGPGEDSGRPCDEAKLVEAGEEEEEIIAVVHTPAPDDGDQPSFGSSPAMGSSVVASVEREPHHSQTGDPKPSTCDIASGPLDSSGGGSGPSEQEEVVTTCASIVQDMVNNSIMMATAPSCTVLQQPGSC